LLILAGIYWINVVKELSVFVLFFHLLHLSSLIFRTMFAFLSFGLVLLPFVFSKIIDVQVGDIGLKFSPEQTFADAGDDVVFHFHPKNHTVTQSSLANPCGIKAGGFNSGFNFVSPNTSYEALPTFTVHVNNTEPIWVYCAQNLNLPTTHCGAGMVFAINCGANDAPNSFTNFKNAALAYGASLSASPSPYAYTTPPAPTPVPTSYPNSPGEVHTVSVGASGVLAFDPPRISARPFDTVKFVFYAKAHSVTQSTFDDPCRPFNVSGVKGFDSGFMPVANDTTEHPTFDYTVTDTSPVWAYCKQGNHCGQGMVFAINSDEGTQRDFKAFQNVAKVLNGTALAASAAPSSTSTSNSPAHVNVGSTGWVLFVASLLGALL